MILYLSNNGAISFEESDILLRKTMSNTVLLLHKWNDMILLQRKRDGSNARSDIAKLAPIQFRPIKQLPCNFY